MHQDYFGGEKGQVEAEGEGKDAQAYVYVAGDDNLEKREWDFEEFRREKMYRWTDKSWEYAEVDEAVEGNGDPTGGATLPTGMQTM